MPTLIIGIGVSHLRAAVDSDDGHLFPPHRNGYVRLFSGTTVYAFMKS